MRTTLLAGLVCLGLWLGRAEMAGAAVVASVQSTGANHDFTVSVDVTPGTGPLAGFSIARYLVRFDPSSATANAGAIGLQSIKVTLKTVSPVGATMKFKFVDQDGDGIPDPDVFGLSIPDLTARTNNSGIGTFVRVHPTGGFLAMSVSPDLYLQKSPESPPPPPDRYLHVTLFHGEGFQQNPPNGQRGDANAKSDSGTGALFAVAVVPVGTTLETFGNLAADQGGIGDFDVTAVVPEPGAIGALAALVGVSGHRWRVRPAGIGR